MSNYAISLKRTSLLLAALAFTAALLVANLGIFGMGHVGAAQLTQRSLTLTSSLDGTNTTGAANSATNGSDATHTFSFDPATDGATIRSMRFEYCTTAIGACTPPTSVSVESGTAITVQTEQTTGAFANAYGIDATISDDDMLCIDNVTGNVLENDGTETVTIAFDDIRNPDTEATFFVRISLYSAVDCGTLVDDGTVASAITTGIAITSRVVETLGFSTTALIDNTGIPAEGASCTPLTGTGAIALGDPTDNTLSIATTYDDYSAFRLYTNAANGVLVQYAGNTLSKASPSTDTITAIGGTAAASDVGNEQFGLAVAQTQNGQAGAGWDNLDDTWPNDTAGRLELDAQYLDGDGTIVDAGTASFAFDAAAPNTPKTIAQSDTAFGGYVTCDSAAVRYIANIHPTTAAGVYTTTVVYFAVPTF